MIVEFFCVCNTVGAADSRPNSQLSSTALAFVNVVASMPFTVLVVRSTSRAARGSQSAKCTNLIVIPIFGVCLCAGTGGASVHACVMMSIKVIMVL